MDRHRETPLHRLWGGWGDGTYLEDAPCEAPPFLPKKSTLTTIFSLIFLTDLQFPAVECDIAWIMVLLDWQGRKRWATLRARFAEPRRRRLPSI